MKKSLLLSACLLLGTCSTLLAQTEIHFNNGCNFKSGRTSGDYTLFDPSKESESMVDKVLGIFAITPRPFVLKASNVDNAQATVKDNERYLLYSNEFLRNTSKDAQTKWAATGVFAHEIAHHVLLQNLNETDARKRRGYELAADMWAAKVMARMGATKEQALSAIKTLKIETDASYYPDIKARLEGMESAFDAESEIILKEKSSKRAAKRTTLNIDPRSFNQWNIVNATSVSAFYDDEIVTIDVSIPTIYYNREVTIMLCSNDPNMPVRTLKGTGDHLVFNARKNSQQVTWNYQLDNVTQNAATRAGQLKLYVYLSNELPPINGNKKMRALGIATGLAGLAVGAYSFKLRGDAKADWDKNYFVTREGADYSRADKQYVNSQYLLLAGSIVTAVGITILVVEKRKHTRARQSICYTSPAWQLEPMIVSANSIGMGIRLQF